jgi:hypothetical protein
MAVLRLKSNRMIREQYILAQTARKGRPVAKFTRYLTPLFLPFFISLPIPARRWCARSAPWASGLPSSQPTLVQVVDAAGCTTAKKSEKPTRQKNWI